ncbi:Nucleoside diphosphate kinase [Trichinella pseudospiralis]|uniref:Nucleoside diphosphate kinase n=1 Tax=Trichinella pseudospiralis TaxID=6337 RepID=A0A0V1IPS0_TRIPS|nr:Nucleoside diphosphate kinase [Trichinella pseudospiralis]KRZ24181.1 Nucleoside diphosphate kinase [Trichinella pseudospiralis]KRZ36198.1 Nucleoside diphosphate kinase [Trichinella pseudospiralis]
MFKNATLGNSESDRTMSNPERTFLAVKPDGVQRGLVNEVLRRFEQRGYKLIGLKMLIFYCCLIDIFVGCDYASSCSFKSFFENDAVDEFSSNTKDERTLVVVKPDGVQRGLIHQVLRRFEQRGFKLVSLKMLTANDDLLNKHYAEHVGKGFFPSLKAYMSSGPVVAMVWEGRDVVKAARNMLGATRPLESAPGTLRGDFCIDVGRNLVHGSDSVESAKREIALWFKPEELCKWEQSTHSWIYES